MRPDRDHVFQSGQLSAEIDRHRLLGHLCISPLKISKLSIALRTTIVRCNLRGVETQRSVKSASAFCGSCFWSHNEPRSLYVTARCAGDCGSVDCWSISRPSDSMDSSAPELEKVMPPSSPGSSYAGMRKPCAAKHKQTVVTKVREIDFRDIDSKPRCCLNLGGTQTGRFRESLAQKREEMTENGGRKR